MGKLNLGAQQQMNAALRAGESSGTKWMNLKAGSNIVRLLPPYGNAQTLGRKRVVHWVTQLGDDGKAHKRMLTCPATNVPDNVKFEFVNCPLCKFAWENREHPVERIRNLASELAAGRSYLLNVIDRSTDGDGAAPDTNICVLAVPKTVMSLINSYLIDPEYYDLSDPRASEGGRDIEIVRNGTGRNTKYEVKPRPRCTDASKEYDTIEKLEEHMADLDKLVAPVDMEALLAAVPQLSFDNDAEVEGDDAQLPPPPPDDMDAPVSGNPVLDEVSRALAQAGAVNKWTR